MSLSLRSDRSTRDSVVRRSERVRTAEVARLLTDAGAGLEVRLLDISAEGFLIECDEPFAPGSVIWLEIASLPLVSGTVVWQQGRKVGGEFTHRLKWRSLHRFQLADQTRGLRSLRRGKIFT